MTDISGAIAVNQTWGDDTYPSPIKLTGNATLGAGIAVSVLPGVQIIAEGACYIDVSLGDFHATGEAGRPVVFSSERQHRNGWVGIINNSTTGLNLQLENCIIKHASTGVHLDNAYANIKHVVFSNCEIGLEMSGTDPELGVLDHMTFEKCRTGVKFHSDLLATAGQYMTDCTFKSNDVGVFIEMAVALADKGHRFWNNTLAAVWAAAPPAPCTLDLTGIWWGSDSGPYDAALNPTGTGDKLALHADYTTTISPWTEFGRYVPIMDDVRDYMARLFALSPGEGSRPLDLLTDDVLESIVDRKEDLLDSWYLGGRTRTKRLFARGTETNEAHDMMARQRMFRTDYWPILTVTAVSRRTGQGTYSTVSENEFTGWYSSAKMKEIGQVMLSSPSSYEKDAARISYTHGYYDAPDYLKDVVLKMAAIEVYQGVLQFGENDPFKARIGQLQAEIDEYMAAAKQTKGKSWAVV